MNSHLRETAPCAFVMPNTAARRSLSSAGWVTMGTLHRHVLILNPADTIQHILKVPRLADLVGILYKGLVCNFISSLYERDFRTVDVPGFDETFNSLWESLDKKNMILMDRSAETLRWRIADHPLDTFHILKVLKSGDFIGYLVYQLDETHRVLSIYDILSLQGRFVGPMICALARASSKYPDLRRIQITLSACHPYASTLRKLGFVRRKDGNCFQIFPPEAKSSHQWCLTAVDKDV
jgi:hypothetical protein